MPASDSRGSRPRVRGALRLAAAIALSIAAAEAFSAVPLGLLRGNWWPDFPATRARRAASSLDAHMVGAGTAGSQASATGGERATLRIDPHLGWVHAAGDGINNAGFRSPVDYPWVARADEMVVGVFGGSVAESLCSRQRKRLENGLREIAASRGYGSVRVLCFAIVGHREPQGLFAFERYADTVDLAIFLEGFNEAVFWSEPGYPADFPNIALWRPFANAPSPREVALAGRRDALAEERTRLADAFDRPVVRHSAAAQLGWEVLMARLDRARADLDAEAEAVAQAARTGHDPVGFDEARARDRYFVGFEGTLRDAAAIGRRRHVPVLHALQPNQYVDGSKPFTAEEEERLRGNAAIHRFVAAGWPKLRTTWASAASDGLDAVDLTEVFSGTTETVYGDDCCHLNDVGNRMLAERLLAEIGARSALVAGIAAPGERPDRLRAAREAPATPAPVSAER